MEWFNKAADIKLDHVPYRGAGQAINDLVAGHVKVAFLGPTATLPQAAAQKIRLLAQSGEARSPSMPDLPTLQEAGYQGIVLESWFAAFAPLGTPAAIIARLNAEFDKALADQSVARHPVQDRDRDGRRRHEKLAKLARDGLREIRAHRARGEHQDRVSSRFGASSGGFDDRHCRQDQMDHARRRACSPAP